MLRWWTEYLTSLLFREGVLREDEDPLLLGGRSPLPPLSGPELLPFSLISLPGPPEPRAGCSPFGWGDCGSCKDNKNERCFLTCGPRTYFVCDVDYQVLVALFRVAVLQQRILLRCGRWEGRGLRLGGVRACASGEDDPRHNKSRAAWSAAYRAARRRLGPAKNIPIMIYRARKSAHTKINGSKIGRWRWFDDVTANSQQRQKDNARTRLSFNQIQTSILPLFQPL